jgi:hypothetical protein
MPLNAGQIMSLSCQEARCPGFVAGGQALQKLNAILQDLAQTYDFDLLKQTFSFSFNPSQINSLGQAYQNLPANYLRGIYNESFYVISGVPYPMINTDLAEFDMFVQQAGLANFPVFYATDMSLAGQTNSATGTGGAAVPVMLFWQVPSGAYPATVRYFSLPADITLTTAIPWFPNQTYLIRRLSGELMALTDDERQSKFLGDSEDQTPEGAGVMLRKYLKLKDDKSTRTAQVQLDRRRFGTSFDRLRNTKTIGWVVLLTIVSDGIISAVLNGGLWSWVT